jgi:hypothetical protein
MSGGLPYSSFTGRRRNLLLLAGAMAAYVLALGLTVPALAQSSNPTQFQQPGNADDRGFIQRMLDWWNGRTPQPAVPPETQPTGNVLLFDDIPSFTFTETRVSVGEKAGKAVLRVRRSAALGREARIRFETIAGTATAGTNFIFSAGELVFAAGESEKAIDVGLIDNELHQPGRIFQVRLTAVGSEKIETETATIEIQEDDPAPRPSRRGQLVALPAEVSLSSVEVGMRNDAVLNLSNQGGRNVQIDRIEYPGISDAITIEANTCQPAPGRPAQSLTAGSQCAISFAFRPLAGGQVKASIVISWREIAMQDDLQAPADLRSGVLSVPMAGIGLQPVPPPDPMAEKIAEARRQRQSGSSLSISAVDEAPAPLPLPQYGLTDDDFRKIGLQRNYFTLPVIRSRIITTDRYIPCVLETGIISERAGGVICVVESHVYSADGRNILIPGGTRAEGDYEPLGKNGESRLNITWKRFMRPDGASFYTKDGFQAHDIQGNVALAGEVDNRWFEKYGSALFVTALSTAAAFAVPERNTAGSQQEALFSDRANSAQRNFSEGMLNVARQQLEENLDLRPVTRIRAGERLVIRPTLDLWLPTPQTLVATAMRQEAPLVASGGGQPTTNTRQPPASGGSSTGGSSRPPPVTGRPAGR